MELQLLSECTGVNEGRSYFQPAPYGMYSCFVEGRTQDAVAYARRALERDPLSSDLNTRLGTFLYHAREYDEAIELLRRVLERDPTYADAENCFFHALAHTGKD